MTSPLMGFLGAAAAVLLLVVVVTIDGAPECEHKKVLDWSRDKGVWSAWELTRA